MSDEPKRTVPISDSPETEKKALRHDALALRKTLVNPGVKDQAGEELGKLAGPTLRSLGLTAPTTIAAFISMGSEVPMWPLLELLHRAGFRVIIPKLGPSQIMRIDWGEYDGKDHVTVEKTPTCGFRRPEEPDGPSLGAEALYDADLILIPALGVAPDGARLGRGAGWYDRALPHAKPTTPVLAVCWPWETSTPVTRQRHDVPVDGTLTPSGVRWITGSHECGTPPLQDNRS